MSNSNLSKEVEAVSDAMSEKFFVWLKAAESIVDAHYHTETIGARSALVVQIANSLMLQHRLGKIEEFLGEKLDEIANFVSGR